MVRSARLRGIRLTLAASAAAFALLAFAGCGPAPSSRPATTDRGALVGETTLAYIPTPLGAPAAHFGRPMVTHVKIVDLDRDGLPDVLYCDAAKNTVRWIRQTARGAFAEEILAEVAGPAHVEVADLYGTGRLDVLVASMGQILPTNERLGAVVVLENLDNRQFRRRVLLDQVARVTDVRAANLTGHPDGRLDLVVGQFGYAQGETRWMENLGDWNFRSHVVNTQSGCVHTPVADFDRDGRPDFVALISQEWEEIHAFRNLGAGQWREAVVWGSTNEDYGSSGMETADVNGDGQPDLIYTNGDGFDYAAASGRPWHGMQWLENSGDGRFIHRRVGKLAGAYGPCAGDLNGDGTIDLLAVSTLFYQSSAGLPSMKAWLNDGRGNFSPVVLAHRPTQLVTADLGDLNGDGVLEIVTGGFHALPPFEQMTNITYWRRR